ncbi:hypothetical protein GCM10009555_023850 [Acrocarpospora macrocephala]|uniref:HTH cro/C1-type domain-containing protein n=1 Tax=Acrocarpospora macrocephala TaxID=150177 RepID=A0A5M3WSF5_9ACTN|nr:helix-turn-helix transcriptional regulator [Acrocarpospora macrocephala]GES12317.1 hypothetical protein Amac_059140 [Acrocarpospora macrocephala]
MTTSSPKSNPIDPNQSPWHLFGFALRHWREQVRNIHLRPLAEEIHWSYSLLAKWERGEQQPHADAVKALDARLGADGYLVALHTAAEELDRLRRNTLNTASPAHSKDEDMERRRLLQLAAAGAGIGVLGAAGEPVRQLLDLSFGDQHRSVEDWELACADHLHAINTRPADQVHNDLLADLSEIQRQLHTAGDNDRIELNRVTAVLAAFHASVLVRLGEPGSALRWYRTARTAADATNDLDLRVRIRAHEAGHSEFGLHDPATALRLIHSAQQITGMTARPSVGQATLLRAQAKILALLGRHDEARRTLQALIDLVETSQLPVVLGFWDSSFNPVHFTASQVFSAAGNEAEASQAQEHTLASNPHGYHTPINLRLHTAWCTVVNGGVDEGIRQAATVIDSLPDAYRNVMIMETARRVFSAVPLPQRERPVVEEFREMLAVSA